MILAWSWSSSHAPPPAPRRCADTEAWRHPRRGVEPGPARPRSASVHVDHHLPGPQPRLPGPGGLRSRPQDQAGPGRVVDHQRRRQDVDVQAAQGREVPQRPAAHRKRREVLARSHPRSEDGGARTWCAEHHRERAGGRSADRPRAPDRGPSGAFLARIAGTYQAILPPEAVQGPAFKAIGTGPFQLTEWKTNERVELKRFDGYWEAGLPYLDALTLKPVPDGTVRLTALKTGDAGFVQLIPLESLADCQAAPSKDYVVRTVKGGGGFSAIILNSKKPPFSDVRVRRAVAMAIDKKEVGLGVWRGFAQPVNSGCRRARRSSSACPTARSMSRGARSSSPRRGREAGAKLTHTVGTTANLVPAAQVFQAQLTRIGIDLQLEVLDWPAYIKRQRAMDFTSTTPTSSPRSIRTTRTTATSTPRAAPTSCPAATRTRRPTSCSRKARRRSTPASARRSTSGSSSCSRTRCRSSPRAWATRGRLAHTGEGLRAAHHRAAGVSGGGLPNVWLDR